MVCFLSAMASWMNVDVHVFYEGIWPLPNDMDGGKRDSPNGLLVSQFRTLAFGFSADAQVIMGVAVTKALLTLKTTYSSINVKLEGICSLCIMGSENSLDVLCPVEQTISSEVQIPKKKQRLFKKPSCN